MGTTSQKPGMRTNQQHAGAGAASRRVTSNGLDNGIDNGLGLWSGSNIGVRRRPRICCPSWRSSSQAVESTVNARPSYCGKGALAKRWAADAAWSWELMCTPEMAKGWEMTAARIAAVFGSSVKINKAGISAARHRGRESFIRCCKVTPLRGGKRVPWQRVPHGKLSTAWCWSRSMRENNWGRGRAPSSRLGAALGGELGEGAGGAGGSAAPPARSPQKLANAAAAPKAPCSSELLPCHCAPPAMNKSRHDPLACCSSRSLRLHACHTPFILPLLSQVALGVQHRRHVAPRPSIFGHWPSHGPVRCK